MAWGFGGWSRWCRLLSLDPQNRVLGDELAQVFADLHAEHGVDLRLNTAVREIG